MKHVRLAAILILGVAVLASAGAWADEPATRPAANPGQIHRALCAMIEGRTNGVKPYTQQEWDEMMAFMKDNSPERYNVLNGLELSSDAPVRLDAIRKWRNYNFTKEHFPAIADQTLRRFRLEDDLFYLAVTAQADDGTNAEGIRGKIRDKIAELVQLDFSERQTRIDKLQKMLEEEKTRLASDQAAQDKVIDQRTDVILRRLEKLNRNASAATTRPENQNAADQTPPATPHDPVVNVSKDTDSK